MGHMGIETVGSRGGSMSPIAWMITIAILAAIGLVIYWIFFNKKK